MNSSVRFRMEIAPPLSTFDQFRQCVDACTSDRPVVVLRCDFDPKLSPSTLVGISKSDTGVVIRTEWMHGNMIGVKVVGMRSGLTAFSNLPFKTTAEIEIEKMAAAYTVTLRQSSMRLSNSKK